MNQSNSANSTIRTPVEAVIMDHIEKIKTANKLATNEDAYDHIINYWYMFDATWLGFVRHMHETGRFQ